VAERLLHVLERGAQAQRLGRARNLNSHWDELLEGVG
jgi:hypothetical protein